MTGEGRAEVGFGGGPGGAPRVRLFDGQALLSAGGFANVDYIAGSAQRANFFAGDAAYVAVCVWHCTMLTRMGRRTC